MVFKFRALAVHWLANQRKEFTRNEITSLGEENNFRKSGDISIESNFISDFTAIKIQSFVTNTLSQ